MNTYCWNANDYEKNSGVQQTWAREWQRLLKNAGFEIVEIMNVRTFAKFIIAKSL